MSLLPGARVRMTRAFLRSTGQYSGKVANGSWLIVELQGQFALVNEPSMTDYYTAAELAADPSLRWRRIHAANLETF